jgi:hypothetical protein
MASGREPEEGLLWSITRATAEFIATAADT